MDQKAKIRDFITRTFSSYLLMINDEQLRKGVVSTWVEAIELGGWSIDEVQKMPFTLALGGRRTDINIFEHTLAIAGAALAMAKAEEEAYSHRSDYIAVNYDHLIAGALLHDVGKPIEYEKSGDWYIIGERGKCLRHPGFGAAIAFKHGVTNRVLNIIANHSTEGDKRPRTKETWIIYHADYAFYEAIKESF